MKKFMQVLLAIAIVCSSVTLGVYADDAVGKIDSGVLDFNDVTDANGILDLLNSIGYKNGGWFNNANAEGKDSKISVVDTDAEFGKSIEIKNAGYAGLSVAQRGGAGTGRENLAVEFSVKKSDTGTTLGCGLADSIYPLTFKNDGYINLCGNNIIEYKTNTWYDIKLDFNIEKAYTKLTLREHNGGAWKTYDKFGFVNYWSGNADNMAAFTCIELGYLGGGEETAYIDNIRYFTKDAENITLALSDDFSQVPEIVSDSAVTDPAHQWAISGRTNSVKVGQINGKQALIIDAPAGYTTIGKMIGQLNLPDDTTSIVKFGLGRADQNAKLICYTDALKGSATTALLTFRNDAPGLEKPDYYNLTLGDIHNFEFVYNKQKGIARLLTPANGWYYGDNISGAMLDQSFDFQIVANSPTTVYLSDFRFELIDTNKCEVKDIKLESGYDKNAAALDDKVIFEFNQPIIDTQKAACRECRLYENGTEVTATNDKGETISGARIILNQTEPNKITVAPQVVLKPNTEYRIEMPTLQGGYDEGTTSVSYSFNTTDSSFEFGQPTIDADGTVKVSGKSAYINEANGKGAVIIAAAYDNAGRMVELKYKEIKATKEETFEFKPEFTAEHSSVKAFVWSSLQGVMPYSKSSAK